MPPHATYCPDPRWPELGQGFADPVPPAAFPRHTLRYRNDRAAAEVGLDTLTAAEWESAFARFEPLPGNLAPLALRYHGHQFQSYNPYLGDGRGFLYAQLRDHDGRLLDLGTKGSGTTPWSRGGDGRLTLKGGVREILATEWLEALGVPTSRSFSLFETGEELWRGDEPSPTRSSVLVRLSHSHVRFGTFQRLAAYRDKAGMERLLAYVERHYHPGATGPDRLMRRVAAAIGVTVGRWIAAGFVHGVLNTDNMNITGESFDYGPWRFLPTWDPDFTAAYFDHGGLYAWGRQADAVLWNLEALAFALTTIEAPSGAWKDDYAAAVFEGTRSGILRRLGLVSRGEAADTTLVTLWTRFAEATRAPWDQLFYDWYGGRSARVERSPIAALYADPRFADLGEVLDGYTPRHPERAVPPRVDLLIDTVEALWEPIARADDWGPLERHVAAIRGWGALMT